VTAEDVSLPAPAPTARTGPVWLVLFVALVVCTNIASATWATMHDSHPAGLLWLSSRNRFLVAVVPTGLPLWQWCLIATARLGAAAVVCHMIGRAYGDQALRWFWRFLGMQQEQVGKFEKAFDDAEWLVVPFFVGSNIMWVLSGAARSSWKRLLPLALVGLAARLALLWWLAKQFESQLNSALRFVDRYQWWFLAGSIIVVVLANVRNLRGR
jgi:membrane protein DedA with SNARE-associated domain